MTFVAAQRLVCVFGVFAKFTTRFRVVQRSECSFFFFYFFAIVDTCNSIDDSPIMMMMMMIMMTIEI